MTNGTGAPSLFDTMSEGMRTLAEYFALQTFRGMVESTTPAGNGQPVLVLPGLGGGDTSTQVLRDFLTGKGYTAHGWQHGINTGPNAVTLRHLKRRLDEVYAQNGNRKVALVGHSLGGIYARELARAFPDRVSRVITLGTPFGGFGKKDILPLATHFFVAANGLDNLFHSSAEFAKQSLIPPPVPTTSVYTRNDGVVNWRRCLNPNAPMAENVEVFASHCGMVVNASVFTVIADRLAADVTDEGKRWRPFEMLKYIGMPFPLSQSHKGIEPVAEKPLQPVKLFP